MDEILKTFSSNCESDVEKAVQILWKVIDEAKSFLEDPNLKPEEKRRWAKVLADTIGVLNRLLASRGERQLEEEDLGTLLVKVPKRFRQVAVRRVHAWRRKNS